MSKSKGRWISLYAKFTEWEWYNDIPTKTVFLHLLLTANWEKGVYKGVTIKRGQRAVSVRQLAEECQLTLQQTKTSLAHLISTQSITQTATSKFSIITVINYNDYQRANTLSNQQSTRELNNNQHTLQQSINTDTIKYKYINNNSIMCVGKHTPTPEEFIPPTVQDVVDFCDKRGKPIDAESFVAYYSGQDWHKANGQPLTDWHAAAVRWRTRDEQQGTVYQPKQTSYDSSEIEQRTLNKYKGLK